MEDTLVIFKPSAIQRAIVGTIMQRFERKGLQLVGIKMMQLTDEILNEHYAHLADRPFFQRIKDGMSAAPVIVSCWRGPEAIRVVREMTGETNGRNATSGTIRGDFSVSIQENIIHTSDSVENAKEELNRFFNDDEIFNYDNPLKKFLYINEDI